MTDILRKLSVRQKLIAITMTTVLGVTVFLASMVVLNEAVEKKRSLYQKRKEQLAILAEVISSRSNAAVVFKDVNTATENLNSLGALRSDSALVLAGIFMPDNILFAEYQPIGRPHVLRSQALTNGCHMISNESITDPLLRVCAPIQLDEDKIGEVRIVYDMTSDLESFRKNLQRFLAGVLATVVAALGLAFLLSSWLQRIISEPILYLREAMHRVSSSKDYSVRVSPTGNDELGALVDGFNQMLVQIQLRDTELALKGSELQDQVKTRTRELQQANQQRILWLENLAHILRHELKSATVGVRSSLELIERRSKDQALSKYVERAKTSMNYMAKLLDSVGTASTLESSFDQDPKQRLSITQLITHQSETYRELYPGVDFDYNGDADVHVMASEVRLVQLLDKLIANAVDYHDIGSTIHITAESQDATVLLSVSNHGACLPNDKQRIFELFVSLRDTKHKNSENFGLGLYIVKLIVESHGGQVSAEDLPDRSGARIKVSLPKVVDSHVH